MNLKLKLIQAALKARRSLFHRDNPPDLDFLCIGPAFSGEEWVYHQLSNHNNVIIPYQSETSFYSKQVQPIKPRIVGYMMGAVDAAWFAAERAEVVQLHELFPRLKIIVTVRSPLARWRDAVRDEIWHRFEMDCTRFVMNNGGYAADSLRFITEYVDRRRFPRLAYTVPVWQDIFGYERVHILPYDSRIMFPDSTRYALARFLEIDSTGFWVDAADSRRVPKHATQGFLPGSSTRWAKERYAADTVWLRDRVITPMER